MDQHSIYRNFWKACFKHYDIGNIVPKMWAKPVLTNEEINALFDRISDEEDPFFKILSTFFQDPKGEGRKAIVISIDSTKVQLI